MLSLVYRDLIGEEARLGETLAKRGLRVGASVADQWMTLHDHLQLYTRGLSAAGMLVFAGRPDEGSRVTGIPFTGPLEARERLNLPASGAASSPAARTFWAAVDRACAAAGEAPVESLFGSVHLAHAQPYDFAPEPEVRDASAAHVLRVLAAARPQAALCVGADALATLGRALRVQDLTDLAAAREGTWVERWPPGSRISSYPWAEVPCAHPFRVRVVPVPSLTGAQSAAAERVLDSAFSYVLG